MNDWLPLQKKLLNKMWESHALRTGSKEGFYSSWICRKVWNKRLLLPIHNLELGRMKKAAFIKKDSWIEFHSNTRFVTVDLSNCRNQVLKSRVKRPLSLWFNSFSHFALFIPQTLVGASFFFSESIHSSWRLCAKRLWEKGAARLLVVLDRETSWLFLRPGIN